MQLALEMQQAGWVPRVTKAGHVIMYAPDGETTMTLSRDSLRGRSGRNMKATFERWKKQAGRKPALHLVEDQEGHSRAERCNVCFREFPNGLGGHRKVHNGVQVRCDECGRDFRQHGGLARHKAAHRRDRQHRVKELAMEVMDAHHKLEQLTLAYNLEVEWLMDDLKNTKE